MTLPGTPLGYSRNRAQVGGLLLVPILKRPRKKYSYPQKKKTCPYPSKVFGQGSCVYTTSLPYNSLGGLSPLNISVAFCSPAKSLTFSGLMETAISWQKVKVRSLGKMHQRHLQLCSLPGNCQFFNPTLPKIVHATPNISSRSSREVRIRVPTFFQLSILVGEPSQPKKKR